LDYIGGGDMSDIYKLKLHEEILIQGGTTCRLYAMRVAGGWIYTWVVNSITSSVFVPFDSEFNEGE
jgi:hypothetical protein